MRVGITITGLAMLVAGGLTLSLGFGAFGAERAGAPVIGSVDTGGDLFWPVVAAVAEIATLVGAVWTARQIRDAVRRRRPAVDGPTRMLARASGGDLIREARLLDGVREVRIRLTGTMERPRLVMDVGCDQDAPLGEVYAALDAGPVARYRNAMHMPELVVVVRFRLLEPERELVNA